MSGKTNQDLADKALAEEFGIYISSVAKEIVKPVQTAARKAKESINKVCFDTDTKMRELITAHQEQFSKDSKNLSTCLQNSAEELKDIVSVVASGHDETRQRLIEYAIEQRNDAREEAKRQTVELFNAFKVEVQPQLNDLFEPVRLLTQEIQENNLKLIGELQKSQKEAFEKESTLSKWQLAISIGCFVLLVLGLIKLISFPI
ncbi:hypothetical protein ACFL3I_08280 [Pseudomonadota bacterium]